MRRSKCEAIPWSVFPEPAIPADFSSLTIAILPMLLSTEIGHTL